MKSKKTKFYPVRNSKSGGHLTEGKISNGVYTIRYTLHAILAGCLLVFAAGCENAGGQPSLTEQIDRLKQEKKQLARQIEQSETENRQLEKQLQVLSDLPAEARFKSLYNLQKIKLTGYTNLYDKDKDGRYETLIVYIQPIDEEGDIVKAAGAVDVQLWDLNKESGEALLGQWNVEPDELKKSWFATLIIINYRLTFDVAGLIASDEEALTVKVTFTDYLSGKVFEEQKVIKPR